MRGVRRRLDTELIRRSLCSSRSAAADLIAAGRVLVGGSLASKPATLVASGDPVVVLDGEVPFASRAGVKLDAAIADLGVAVDGRTALDAGASTGGFTDCLLRHGAASVVAVDVGRGQLLSRLAADPRVTVLDGCNVRHLTPELAGGQFDLVTADLSFISLTKVMGRLAALVVSGGDLVLLVKPQFEVGPSAAAKGNGVITDPELHRQAVDSVAAAAEQAGLEVRGSVTSSLRGAAGNTEFFLVARKLAASKPVSEPAAGQP